MNNCIGKENIFPIPGIITRGEFAQNPIIRQPKKHVRVVATTDASVLIPASLNMEAFTITIYETVKKLVRATSNSFLWLYCSVSY